MTSLLLDIAVRVGALLLAAWVGARWLAEPVWFWASRVEIEGPGSKSVLRLRRRSTRRRRRWCECRDSNPEELALAGT